MQKRELTKQEKELIELEHYAYVVRPLIDSGDLLTNGILDVEKIHEAFTKPAAKEIIRVIREFYSRFITLSKFDEYTKILEPILDVSTRNRTWDRNQKIITAYLHQTISSDHIIPSITEISRQTGLSRSTITKHFNDNDNKGIYGSNKQVMKAGFSQLLAVLFEKGIEGDIKAIKTLHEIISFEDKIQARSKQQNFIQINNMQLNQQTFEVLPAGAKNQIEQIISESLRKPKAHPDDIHNDKIKITFVPAKDWTSPAKH